MSLLEAASSFEQYNAEDMDWASEGAANSPARNFIRRVIALDEEEVRGRRILDVGCGTGWFLQECLDHGAGSAVGVEPSNLAKLARTTVPAAAIEQKTFEDSRFAPGSFDFISFLMVTEHMPDINLALSKSSRLLSRTGKMLILTAQFDWFQQQKDWNKVTKEVIRPDEEVVVRIERPSGYGTTNDIVRSVSFWEQSFERASLNLDEHRVARIDAEYAEEEPRKGAHVGQPIFELFYLSRIRGGND